MQKDDPESRKDELFQSESVWKGKREYRSEIKNNLNARVRNHIAKREVVTLLLSELVPLDNKIVEAVPQRRKVQSPPDRTKLQSKPLKCILETSLFPQNLLRFKNTTQSAAERL